MDPNVVKEISHRLRGRRIAFLDRMGKAGFYLGLLDGQSATFIYPNAEVQLSHFDRDRGSQEPGHRIERLVVRSEGSVHHFEFQDRDHVALAIAYWKGDHCPKAQFNLSYGWPYKSGICTTYHASTVKSASAAARVARFSSKGS